MSCCGSQKSCCPPSSSSPMENTPKQTTASCCSTNNQSSSSSSDNHNLISENTTGVSYTNSNAVYESVKEYYGKVLSTTKDLKTSACTSSGAPHPIMKALLAKIPDEVLSKYYGCGSPLPLAGISGLTVLDLGCGSGRDVYLASMLCGKGGKAIGVDMTDEQLQVARDNVVKLQENFGADNLATLEFKKGFIEDLKGAGIEENSVDIVISNCVVNLSPDKASVLKGVYNSLRFGGEFVFSDVYCDRRLPSDVRSHELLFGECIAGALYTNDFLALCKKVGFDDPRELTRSEIVIHDLKLKEILGNAKFYSITYRLFKLNDLEPQCEDYGQIAIYRGGSEVDHVYKHAYTLDAGHVFERNRPVLVCGNTASMLSKPSWLGPYFQIIGDMSTHYGAFDCSKGPSTSQQPSTANSCSPSSCSGSSCC
ncbi:predicted protein [Naegleria gruberi]|uniref:Arsenite methyltransferase n=1 Tax=Naegleria gruberi TaxID=5762 RepID=D2VS40_NAEGR|nr:uncharacterized protein NAEGRDRAFT_51817 [Naegleria gruberi]EFC40357.1 predicted protein [Naegleria gruberi]|eukprot:XP_002673101.1 predicted protein [Naegleria gruberi strain NEG-M]